MNAAVKGAASNVANRVVGAAGERMVDWSRPSSLGCNHGCIAALAYAFTWLSSLIIILMEEDSAWALFHAYQSLICFAIYFVCTFPFFIIDAAAGTGGVLTILIYCFYMLCSLFLIVRGCMDADNPSEPFRLFKIGDWAYSKATQAMLAKMSRNPQKFAQGARGNVGGGAGGAGGAGGEAPPPAYEPHRV